MAYLEEEKKKVYYVFLFGAYKQLSFRLKLHCC